MCKTSSVQTLLCIRRKEREEFKKKKYNLLILNSRSFIIALESQCFFSFFSTIHGVADFTSSLGQGLGVLD